MQQLEITCSELEPIKGTEGILLLDCRTHQERDFCTIEPSQFLPLQEFYQKIQDFEAFKTHPIVIYCHHGVRSLQMTMMMINAGFENVRSLKGGIDAWSIEVDASVPRY